MLKKSYLHITKLQQVSKSTPWKCAIDPLITLEIPLNFLIWDVWEPCICRSTLWCVGLWCNIIFFKWLNRPFTPSPPTPHTHTHTHTHSYTQKSNQITLSNRKRKCLKFQSCEMTYICRGMLEVPPSYKLYLRPYVFTPPSLNCNPEIVMNRMWMYQSLLELWKPTKLDLLRVINNNLYSLYINLFNTFKCYNMCRKGPFSFIVSAQMIWKVVFSLTCKLLKLGQGKLFVSHQHPSLFLNL